MAESMNARAQCSVLFLAAASGSVDALALTALGHVFAGVMTGNLVLMGVTAGSGGARGLPAALALAGYVAGTVLAARVCRGADTGARPGGWPKRVVGCLWLEVLLLGGFAGVAASSGGAPEGEWRTVLLVTAATAMGLQSSAMLAGGSMAAPSTYFTGTLTALFAQLPAGGPPPSTWAGLRLVAVVAGGAAAAGLRIVAAPAAFACPAVLLLVALACQRAGAARTALPAVRAGLRRSPGGRRERRGRRG
ncbi:DUF1275 domain-containing protein [Streptomyces tubbatahanensis]|uniref:DUF1275 domain-containing protein n=1 Tax=Streptomyces tubbatahanensis TaxID=2923272 RepID=A0ABY3XN41_9ACTN|nr:YoaK family protein [Streptomyces tubbatahanensis]UNS95820.1 DUF1275 domain-containing protein [Streptomyces tubbatahanensis]